MDFQGKMQSLTRTILESSYDLIIFLTIHRNAEVRIFLCQWFSEKKVLYYLSNQSRYIFDDLYWSLIPGRYKLGSYTVDKNAAIIWAMLQSHEVME